MKIAFDRISGRSGLRGMWIMNADGTRIRRLANAPGDPSWSPSGARIAFIKDGDLHTIKTDGTGLRHVEATPRIYEDSPAWSPDGTRIAFYKYNRDYLGIFTVRPDGTGLRSLTSFGG
jgi:Tol biopolymer transport system component